MVIRGSWGLSLMLVASASFAQNRFADGFLGTDPSSVRGVYVPSTNDVQKWVDGKWLVYRSFGASFGDNCYDLTDGGVSKLGSTTYFQLLAGNADAGTLVGLSLNGSNADIYRVACGKPAVLVGSFPLAEALWPAQGVATLPSAEDAVLFATTTGVAKLTLQPTLGVTEVVSHQQLVDAFGPDAGALLKLGVTAGGVVTAPDGHAFFTARVPGGTPSYYVLDLPSAGQVRLRLGPYDWRFGAGLTWMTDLDAVIFPLTQSLGAGATYDALGLVPRAGPETWTGRVPPFPALHSPLAGFVPGRGGLYAQVAAPGGNAFERYTFQPQFADFDRDGLSLVQERDAGTSDLLADSDRDGFDDGYELRLAKTLPASDASVPTLNPDPGVVLAHSTLTHYGLDLDLERRFGTAGYAPRVCENDGCFDSAGMVTRYPFSGLSHTFSPDLKFLYLEEGVSIQWRVHDLQNGADRAMAKPPGTGRMIPLVLDGTSAVTADPQEPIGTLQRLGLSTWFPVVQRSRATCPVLATAADEARCAEFSRVPVLEQRIVGFDPVRKLALVIAYGSGRTELYGVGTESAVWLADLTDVVGAGRVNSVRHLPGGGWVVVGAPPNAAVYFSLLLDEAFRTTGRSQRPITFPSDFFRVGFLGREFQSFLIERGPRMNTCQSYKGGRIFVCDSMFGADQKYETFGWVVEWVPMTAAVQPGELLGWVPSARRDNVLGVDRVPPGWVGSAPLWMINRIGREGGVLPWLDWFEFSALLPKAQADAIDVATLGPIESIQSAPDGLKFCLAEPSARRTWELTLDSTTRRAASARLASTVAGSGCAYSATGELVWLEAAPAALVVGSKRIALPGLTRPKAVNRFGETWVVSADREPARCVGADGVVRQTAVQADGLADAFGAVAWIDEKGQGFVSSVEDFCAGRPASESLVGNEVSVWTYLYNPLFTHRSARSHGAVMAVRPDGVLFVAPRQISYFENEVTTETSPPQLFHVFPTWAPFDWNRRTPALDPLRLSDPVRDVADPGAGPPTALVVVPGANASGEWGYFKRPGTLLTMPVDAGTRGPMPDPFIPPKATKCGCSSDGSPWLALSFVVLALPWLRRRRPVVERGFPRRDFD